jgi:hypothetical protein
MQPESRFNVCVSSGDDFRMIRPELAERLFGRLFMRELLASLTPSSGVIWLFAA